MDFYDLSFKDSAGKSFSMNEFRGNVVLIVNTATRCGFAPQFEGLEKLYQNFKDAGLRIIGFPCNQFLNQEPESDETMVLSCQRNFGVTFQLAQKTDVNGRNAHPVFVYLRKKLPGGIFGSRIKWNFTKFLISREGKPYRRYAPMVQPSVMEKDIIPLLNLNQTAS